MLCFSEAATLRANDTTGWDYEWSNGAAGPSLTTSLPGTYWLSYHTAPAPGMLTHFYLRPQHTPPQLQASAGCYDEKNAVVWAIPVDTTTFTYLWQNESGDTLRGPLQTNQGDTLSSLTNGATYTLRITTHSGCDTLLRITILPCRTITSPFLFLIALFVWETLFILRTPPPGASLPGNGRSEMAATLQPEARNICSRTRDLIGSGSLARQIIPAMTLPISLSLQTLSLTELFLPTKTASAPEQASLFFPM